MLEKIRNRKKDSGDFQEEKIKFTVKDWWKYLIGILILVIYLFPFYVVINVSLKASNDLTSRIHFPDEIVWDNFKNVIQSGDIFIALKNNIIITVLILLFEIVLGCMAAYGIQRNPTKLTNFIRSAVMAVMMITPLTVLVGVYSTMSKLHLISTYIGITLVMCAFGLPLVIFLYSNFMASIPIELDEAASIDGASNFQIFYKIILPQLKTVTVSVIILQGVSVWNEYTFANYFLTSKSMQMITLVIKSYFSSVTNDYGSAAATAVLGMLPLVIVYLCLQKYFIKGQIDGAVKG